MRKFILQAINQFDDAISGNAAANVEFNVYNAGGGLADIYTNDGSGLISQASPLLTDGRGRYEFYADNGRYSILFEDQTIGLQNDVTDISIYEYGSAGARDAATTAEAIAGTSNKLPDAIGVKAAIDNVTDSYISCIPRCDAGVFSLLDDSTHAPVGFSGVSQPDDYQIRVTYSQAYTKIDHLLVNIDDALSPYGVFVGADVGTSFANFTGYKQLKGIATGAGDWQGDSLTDADTSVNVSNDIITISHEWAKVANDVPVVQQVRGQGTGNRWEAEYASQFSISIRKVVDLEGLVGFDGVDWGWVGTPSVSSNQTGISFGWNASTNGLTVTHPAVDGGGSGFEIQATPFGTAGYNVSVGNFSSTQFEVYFFDRATGAQVSVEDTSMQVNIRRKHSLLGRVTSNDQLYVNGPIVRIKSQRFSNVPGNNFWISGSFTK